MILFRSKPSHLNKDHVSNNSISKQNQKTAPNPFKLCRTKLLSPVSTKEAKQLPTDVNHDGPLMFNITHRAFVHRLRNFKQTPSPLRGTVLIHRDHPSSSDDKAFAGTFTAGGEDERCKRVESPMTFVFSEDNYRIHLQHFAFNSNNNKKKNISTSRASTRAIRNPKSRLRLCFRRIQAKMGRMTTTVENPTPTQGRFKRRKLNGYKVVAGEDTLMTPLYVSYEEEIATLIDDLQQTHIDSSSCGPPAPVSPLCDKLVKRDYSPETPTLPKPPAPENPFCDKIAQLGSSPEPSAPENPFCDEIAKHDSSSENSILTPSEPPSPSPLTPLCAKFAKLHCSPENPEPPSPSPLTPLCAKFAKLHCSPENPTPAT